MRRRKRWESGRGLPRSKALSRSFNTPLLTRGFLFCTSLKAVSPLADAPSATALQKNLAPLLLTLNHTTTHERSAETLRAVGAWLKVNGEAIYGAQRTPFGEEFGGVIGNRKNPDGKPVWGALADWRCTAKPGRLYFTVFSDWFSTSFELPAFKNKIKTAWFLDDPVRTPLKVATNKNTDRRTVSIPRQAGGNTMANVLVVEYEGDKIEKQSTH